MYRSKLVSFLLLSFLLFYSIHAFSQTPSCLGDTILYEDFANDIQGNSGVGAWDTTGTEAQYWEYDFDGPDNLTADSLNSPSAGNGFMTFDLYGNHSGGFAAQPVEGYLESPVMDLSGYSTPLVSFYSYFSHCCNTQFNIVLEVSTDGGATWGNSFNISEMIPRNEYSPNPYRLRFDLTNAVSSNPSNVKIRFSWVDIGPSTNYSSEYFFSVDDIVVKNANLNDLKAGSASYEPVSGGMGSFPFFEYNEIPMHQIVDMSLGAKVCNIGRDSLTGVQVQADIFRNGAPVDTIFSAAQTLDAQTCYGNDSYLKGVYTPDSMGDYLAAISIVSDSIDCTPSNNLPDPDSLKFYLTDSVYALDNYRRKGVTDTISAPLDGSGGYQDFKVANLFKFFAADNIESVSFYAHPGSTDDGAGPFTVKVYDVFTTELATSGQEYIDFSDPARDTGMITVELNNSYAVSPGDSLYIAVNYAGGANNFGVGTSSESNQGNSSMIYGDFGGAGVTWYMAAEVPIVRLGRGITTSVKNTDENAFNLGHNFPNPFTDQTTITYELAKASNVKFEVFDVAGKQVMNIDRGNEAQGEHQILIDGGALEAGIYYYALTVDGERRTRKMVITE